MLQQGGLADTRLAAQHQHPALPRSDSGDEPIQHVALADTVEQARRWPVGVEHAGERIIAGERPSARGLTAIGDATEGQRPDPGNWGTD